MVPATFAALLVLGTFDVNGTVVTETRAGETPIVPGEAPRAFAATLLTPAAELRLDAPGLDVAIGYGPRIFWQDPNAASESGPLVLHSASLRASGRPSERAALNSRAVVSAGRMDYSLLSQTLGASQGTLPQVLDILTATARADLTLRATRRWQFVVAARADHLQPLGDEPATTMPTTPTLPRQTLGAIGATSSFRVSRLQTMSLMTEGGYATYSNGVEVATVRASAGWQWRFDRGDRLDVIVGATYGRDLGTMPAFVSTSPVTPNGSLRLDAGPLAIAGIRLRWNVSLGADSVIDPVLARVTPRGTATAGISALPALDWIVGIEGSFATSLVAEPLPNQPDETTVGASLSVRHRVSENLLLDVGLRYGDRGPSLASSSFAFHQRQAWAYLTIAGASRRTAAWTSP